MSSAARPSDYHDALTELPNRRLLDDRLRQALHLAERQDRGIALMLIELSGLAGAPDDAVRAAARRLAACLRKADTLARWGAAEFAVVVTDITDDAHCRLVAERLLGVLAGDAAVGVSRFPADARDAEALVRNADAARVHARERGRRQYQLYAR